MFEFNVFFFKNCTASDEKTRYQSKFREHCQLIKYMYGNETKIKNLAIWSTILKLKRNFVLTSKSDRSYWITTEILKFRATGLPSGHHRRILILSKIIYKFWLSRLQSISKRSQLKLLIKRRLTSERRILFLSTQILSLQGLKCLKK